MRCYVCGSRIKSIITGLPFKIHESTIVILKGLPVLQCEACREYSLDDSVMQRVDEILENVDNAAELEVIKYAA
ncbi:MAG: YgiT-type zinc finger protein [Methylococcales bacterium]